MFYLWIGPLSPCFGKDRMATFETHFVADPATHEETKNPYFTLIHDAAFCARMLREFGVDTTSSARPPPSARTPTSFRRCLTSWSTSARAR